MAAEFPSQIYPVGWQLEVTRIQGTGRISVIEHLDFFKNGSGAQPINTVERDLMRVGVREVQVNHKA